MLTALFTSKVRIEILSAFFMNQGKDFYVRELQRITGEDYKNVHQELQRLEKIGLFSNRKEGNLKYYSLNKNFILHEELKSIFLKTRGAGPILNDVLSAEKDIIYSFIYGSLAEGKETAKSDIDIMVIGKIFLERLLKVLREPERILGRDINPSLYDLDEIKKRIKTNDPFIKHVLKSPKIFLIGDEKEFRKISQQRADKAV